MRGGLRKTIARLRPWLDENLFVEPRRPPAEGRGRRAALTVAFLALAVLLQILRLGWNDSVHSLWAEDGQIFLYGALTKSFLHDLVANYAGYLVVVPRLIGEFATLFPLQDAPQAVAVASGTIVGLCGLAVWHGGAGLIPNRWLRGALVAATVLVPVGSLESVASAAYVPWFMLFGTFWVLFLRPATTGGAVCGGGLALATGLSTPGVWFFAPVAILRSLAARDRRDAILLSGFWVGALVQIPVIANNNEPNVTPLWTSDIWTDYLQRVVNGAVFGLRLGEGAWEHFGWAFLIALLACVVVGLVALLREADWKIRAFAAIAIATSLVMFVVSLYQRAVGTAMLWPAGNAAGGGGRYAIVPALLLVSAGLVLVGGVRRGWSRGGLSWAAWAVAGLLVVSISVSFWVDEPEGRGTPSWEASLQTAAASCLGKPGDHEVLVATSPPGWGVPLTCDRLDAYAPAPRR